MRRAARVAGIVVGGAGLMALGALGGWIVISSIVIRSVEKAGQTPRRTAA